MRRSSRAGGAGVAQPKRGTNEATSLLKESEGTRRKVVEAKVKNAARQVIRLGVFLGAGQFRVPGFGVCWQSQQPTHLTRQAVGGFWIERPSLV